MDHDDTIVPEMTSSRPTVAVISNQSAFVGNTIITYVNTYKILLLPNIFLV